MLEMESHCVHYHKFTISSSDRPANGERRKPGTRELTAFLEAPRTREDHRESFGEKLSILTGGIQQKSAHFPPFGGRCC